MYFNISLTENQAALLTSRGYKCEEGDKIEVDATLVVEDNGIGPYEFWGGKYHDSNIITYVESATWWDGLAKESVELEITKQQEEAILKDYVLNTPEVD